MTKTATSVVTLQKLFTLQYSIIGDQKPEPGSKYYGSKPNIISDIDREWSDIG